MKIYLVQNTTDNKYLCIECYHLVSWVPKDKASVYNTYTQAHGAGDFAFDCEDDAHTKYNVVEIDTNAALNILRDLDDACPLSDFVYDIRDIEGLGWDGPRVIKWGNAVRRAEELLKQVE